MRVQPKRIMCTVDFSDFTAETLGYSVALCKEFNAALLLVHIITAVDTYPGQERMTVDHVKLQEKNILSARKQLGNMVENLTIDHEIIVLEGNPADKICRLALEKETDLVITATHGKSGIKKLLLGSVTEKLIKTIHCPLLILNTRKYDPVSLTDYEMKLKKILVGCDFSPDSKLAFDYGLSLAQEFQAEVYLTHVIKPTEHVELKASDYINIIPGNFAHWNSSDYFEMQEKVTAKNRDRINELRKRLEGQLYYMLPEECKHWCTPHTDVLTGEPYKELVQFAKVQEVDMIVLGIRGHTLWEKLLVGSTTDRVIRHAPCPVLVVREMGG
ncbi:universal stress protein [Desulforhopalus sp. IMCC35007]|uniref:universal stress protein n=1 Tax=Desulforhopalus sp. IMCC35007 TaxID=2569543 RepID=UPI0010ADFF16|nr:universal stress protein [Desulforhopalus sp. IMCC35007]TKB06364.1 universal stress protein [Desulforhopalus sp. IMCC35007]